MTESRDLSASHVATPKVGTKTVYAEEGLDEKFHEAVCALCGQTISQRPGRGGEYDHDI